MADAECAVEGCGRHPDVRGWCNRHYLRWRRPGDPLGSHAATSRAHQARSGIEGEEWRPTPSNHRYEASSRGRVRNASTWVVKRTPIATRGGYPIAMLWDGTKDYSKTVHSLVMEAFAGPRPEGCEIRHLNGNPADNSIGNLAYGTRSENVQDAVLHGTHYQVAKTHCKKGHPYAGENVVKESGGRKCRTCHREHSARRSREYRARKRNDGGNNVSK